MNTIHGKFLTAPPGAGVGGILAGYSTGSDGTATPTGTLDQFYALTGSYEIPTVEFSDPATYKCTMN